MSDSFLSFSNSQTFRQALLAKNLPPYTIEGVYTPPSSNINQETELTVSNVIDSPNEYITENPFGNQLYPLNEYGPEGGYNLEITYNNSAQNNQSNKGEYDPNDTVLDLVNEFFIDAAYIENIYGPIGGFNNLVSITDIQNNNKIYEPYWDPPTFVPSIYGAYNILQSTDPSGSNGRLSEDSFIVQLGSQVLRDLLLTNQAFWTQQNLQNRDSINFNITIDGINDTYLSRLEGTYVPYSPIPGDYFLDGVTNRTTDTLGEAVNLIAGRSTLLGGALNGGLTRTINPSQIFLQNTNEGQKGLLFSNISYNIYRPAYGDTLLGGIATNLITTGLNSLIDNFGLQLPGAYYVGSSLSEPSFQESPINAVPIDVFGRDTQALVLGPDVLGKDYEKNEQQINFGLKGKSTSDSGTLNGDFVWVSPKYKDNAGYKAKPGGGVGSLDPEFRQISSNYQRDESTNIDFRPGSILDDTQRLINSADGLQGEQRLRHVGNAMNQVSKVFNDGYKELTKGSKVVSYVNNATGAESGIEYCRVFAKDTPYYIYSDLQKSDGITTTGRRFTNSVLDKTYNLNISPTKNPGSSNIQKNEKGEYVAKKYMFSIENLAWRTSSRPGYTYDELPDCEKGPNGGRVMWFPPYDLTFSDSSTPQFSETNFLGRPEPIYTYKHTNRTGSISWKIVVDHPSILNLLVDKQLKGSDERINSVLESFFAGCAKYDIYELAKKFNKVPLNELLRIQQVLNQPRLTKEQVDGVIKEIPADNTTQESNITTVTTTKTEDDPKAAQFADKYLSFGFYFDNDIPGPSTGSISNQDYESAYNSYISQKQTYTTIASQTFNENSLDYNVSEFFDQVVIGNFEVLTQGETNFFTDAYEILNAGGTINIKLKGAASASASPEYNQKLSERRVDSVVKFIKNFKVGDINLNTFIENQKLIVELESSGEDTDVTPKNKESLTKDKIFCNVDVKDKNDKVTSNSQKYSVSAMSCRRVAISSIDAKLQTTTTITETKDVPSEVKKQVTEQIRTAPTVEPTSPDFTGISKKILRLLLSECDYFDMLKEENPMVYTSLKEKIKFFNPAFHSITPEGLNARLTFLNQCGRPGETIPVISDGKPRVNDAINTSFGAPPVLVLRIGDFYHSKIIPDSIQFSYDPLIYDMNPEGIGLQPMIAKVTMNFKFIGGHGLAKPIEELQNALSFNYYANTEIYDERATPTEDTSKIDKEFFDLLSAGEYPAKPVNQQENNGGTTIGVVVTNIPVTDGQEGEITYQKVMDDLVNQTLDYFKTLIAQLESINNNDLNGNYYLLQIVNYINDDETSRIYRRWGPNDIFNIYGKPTKYGEYIKNIFDTAVEDDISNNENPIIYFLVDNEFDEDVIENVRQNLKNYLKDFYTIYSDNVVNTINLLVDSEKNLVQTIRKIMLVNGNTVLNTPTDGFLLSGNKPRVYNIEGTSIINNIDYESTSSELSGDFQELENVLNNFNNKILDSFGIIDEKLFNQNDNNFLSFYYPNNLKEGLKTDGYQRFYVIMSRVLTNKTKKEEFKNKIITQTVIQRDKSKKISKKIDNILNDLEKQYNNINSKYEKIFTDLLRSPDYIEYTDGIETVLYKKGKPRKFEYTTVPGNNNTQQEDEIKKLYLDIPKFN